MNEIKKKAFHFSIIVCVQLCMCVDVLFDLAITI